jgi:WD40 repeat protein
MTPAEVGATELSRKEAAVLQDQTFIQQLGVPAMGRRPVRLFVSFDEEHDGKAAKALLTGLEANFRASRSYEYEVWSQGEILAGEIPGREIAEALERSDFGLLFLSTHRVGGLREDVDLKTLVESERPLIPVPLGNLSARLNLRGLESHHIFKSNKRTFSSCKSSDQKERFVQELFEEIEARLDRWVEKAEQRTAAPPLSALVGPAGLTLGRKGRFDEKLARELMLSYERKELGAYVDSSGAETNLAEDLDRRDPARPETRGVNMIEALEAWARDPAGTSYAAILGEYGMGKTTLLRKLTDVLLTQRALDPSVPLPIFIDLRFYSETIQKEGRVPANIEALLREALDRAWRSSPSEVGADEILRLIREEGAILIFDGLDEKLVHLTEAQGQAFIRTLWQALPPRVDVQETGTPAGRRGRGGTGIPGKLIFSCRSHYFKTLRSQRALFLGEDREGLRPASYRAWVLLPFNEEQIRLYLGKVLGEEHVDVAMELFGAVHNLNDLVPRPYLLSLITGQIHELERKRMKGEPVLGVTIYDILVERWLDRDNGKHKLHPEDKLRLMEEVAGAMWAGGDRAWPWERLRTWLGERIVRDDVLRARYAGVSSQILEEDLRTATFIIRPDDSEREFRFAHTSLQEYFLAKHLCRALAAGVIEPWNLAARAMPSAEAFVFLGELVLTERDARIRDTCLAALSAMLSGNHPAAAVAAFRYWILAISRELPAPRPARVDLRGADLSRLVIRGRSKGERMNLRGADLFGATLTESFWEDADLSGATLAGTCAQRAEFHGVIARNVDVTGADLTGAIWRECDARGLRGGDSAEWYGFHWIHAAIEIEAIPQEFGRLGTMTPCPAYPAGIPSIEPPWKKGNRVLLSVGLGHADSIEACAWSPDGTQVLSGSEDCTLKVWDARTGEEVRTLAGHRDTVYACAWSPCGAKILSCSRDGTLKIWDVRGEVLQTLVGHRNGVRTCAWSPDGTQVLSGSEDCTLKVWDARTGEELRVLVGHGGWVSSCAWSPDGKKIISGSGDKTLKAWDAGTGEEIRTFAGHRSDVRACAWSPDGAQILSGSEDNTSKVWDAQTGQELRTLAGHTNTVMSCAWSPDGMQVLSGSGDKTLKIWDAQTGEELRMLTGHRAWISACAWSPDGTQIASVDLGNMLKVWDARMNGEAQTFAGHFPRDTEFAWSPDGMRVVSGAWGYILKVWDARTGEQLRTLVGHSSWITACAWSPDGTRVVSGSDDSILKVWDARTGVALLTLAGHGFEVSSCAWSPDGTQILSGSHDRTLKVWDARTGRELRTLAGDQSLVTGCAWSPDGTEVLSGSYDETLRIWDARTGAVLRRFTAKGGVYACAWSPDGRHLLFACCDKTLKVYDARSGEVVLALPGHRSLVISCAWSPDGTQVLSGSQDRTLKIWDVRTGQELRTLTGHQNVISGGAWSPDGMQILSGSRDRTLKVWDALTGGLQLTFANLPGRESAALDLANNRVLSATPGAWRYLGWQFYDDDLRRWRLLPAEHFGPLPGSQTLNR